MTNTFFTFTCAILHELGCSFEYSASENKFIVDNKKIRQHLDVSSERREQLLRSLSNIANFTGKLEFAVNGASQWIITERKAETENYNQSTGTIKPKVTYSNNVIQGGDTVPLLNTTGDARFNNYPVTMDHGQYILFIDGNSKNDYEPKVTLVRFSKNLDLEWIREIEYTQPDIRTKGGDLQQLLQNILTACTIQYIPIEITKVWDREKSSEFYKYNKQHGYIYESYTIAARQGSYRN